MSLYPPILTDTNAADSKWVWVGEGKAHLPDCAYIRAHVTGEAEGRYAPHTELDEFDLIRWQERLYVADQYPGDIPICAFCERRGA